MSMISSLIDELRKLADEWSGSNMFELARVCREAADTIWQLRDDLQRANAAVQDAEHDESMAWDRVRKAEAESASLRGAAQGLGELCDQFKAENAKLGRENAELRDEIEHLLIKRQLIEDVNTELRELVLDMWRFTGTACKKYPRLFDPAAQGGQVVQLNMIDAFDQRMRELGIEVPA